MPLLSAGAMRYQIRIQQPAPDNSFDGAGSGGWTDVATVSADVKDMLPSRGESIADGLNVAARPSRVRMRYRTGITSAMRVLIGRTVQDDDGNPVWQTDRTTQIITVPAEIGWREGLEFMVEDYSTAGNAA